MVITKSDITWDQFYMNIARASSLKSKDPSTKVGSALVRPDNTLASIGFNGFPSRLPDVKELLENRELKYMYTIHAEMNCIHFCADTSLKGYTIYIWPLKPCISCTTHIIQKGISKVVVINKPSLQPIWDEQWAISKDMLKTANIEILEIDENNFT